MTRSWLEMAKEDLVVGRIEPGCEAATLTRGSLVEPDRLVWIADVAVAANLRLVVASGVVPVGGVEHHSAVAIHVVRQRQPRHDRVGVDSDQPASGLAAHAFITEAEVRGDAPVDAPVVLTEDRVVVDIQRCAALRRSSARVVSRLERKSGIRCPVESRTGLPAASVA